MYTLTVIKKLNNSPAVIRDNFNRDSSACFSRAGAVIHSGVHRSTAFVSLPYALASLLTAQKLGQRALNAWIEATIDGAELEDCELNALAAQFPDFDYSLIHGKQGTFWTACKVDGKFQTRISAGSFHGLAKKLE